MELFRAALGLAIFIIIMSLFVLIGVAPGTAEFTISVASLIIGLIFLAVVIWAIRRVVR